MVWKNPIADQSPRLTVSGAAKVSVWVQFRRPSSAASSAEPVLYLRRRPLPLVDHKGGLEAVVPIESPEQLLRVEHPLARHPWLLQSGAPALTPLNPKARPSRSACSLYVPTHPDPLDEQVVMAVSPNVVIATALLAGYTSFKRRGPDHDDPNDAAYQSSEDRLGN